MAKIIMGFELEINTKIPYEEKNSYHSNKWRTFNNYEFRIERDGSLHADYGTEIITAPFIRNEVDQVFKGLKGILDYYSVDGDQTWWIDKSCGFHINFSVGDEKIQNKFLYKRLLFLRHGFFDFVRKNYPETGEEAIKDYYRKYAQKMVGYKSYYKTRYIEFNILENRIEWRSVNLHHLSHYKNEKLLEEIKKLVIYLFDLIEKMLEIKEETNTIKVGREIIIPSNEKKFYFLKNEIKNEEILTYKKDEIKINNIISLKFNKKYV